MYFPYSQTPQITLTEIFLQVNTEASRGLGSALLSKGTSRDNSRAVTLPADIGREVYPVPEPSFCIDRSKPSASTGYTYVHSASQMTPLATDGETRIRALELELADKAKEFERIQREKMEQKNYIFTLSNRLSAAQTECRSSSLPVRGGRPGSLAPWLPRVGSTSSIVWRQRSSGGRRRCPGSSLRKEA